VPRKKRDTSKKRNAILDAAATVFVQEGYDSASMDRIALLAGASKRTVYNHFASKNILFNAVLERLLEASEGLRAIEYDPDVGLADQLGRFVDAKQATVDNPAWLGLVRVALAVHMRDTALAREALAKYQSGDTALAEWVRAATQDGRLTTDDPELAATMFWALVGGALSWPQLFAGPLPAATVQVLKQEAIDTFLCRYASR